MPLGLKDRLTRGERLLGTIVTLPGPEAAEIMRLAGFDWLFVDLEHGPMGIREVPGVLAAARDVPCVVRVPAVDAVWIKKCLDAGAAGIMVPQVNSATAAEKAVGLCRYPPLGERSVGISRAQGYGLTFGEHVACANDAVSVIVQIEHVDAVKNLDAILGVPGIDAVFVGPYDLSASMGKTGRVGDPEVRAAIDAVTRKTLQARIPLGIFGASPSAVAPYIENGYTLLAVGIDTVMLATAARGVVDALGPGS